MERKDDRFIVEQLKQGTDYGLTLFVRKYQNRLIRVAIEVHGENTDTAGEVINDVFEAAFKGIRTFVVGEEGCLWGWLWTILKRKIIDRRRKTAKENQKLEIYHFNESDLEEMEESSGISSIGIEVKTKLMNDFLGENYSEDKRKGLIYEVMVTFNEKDQLILWDHFQETTHKEIAERDGSDEDASRKQVNRLVHLFFQRIGERTGKNWRQMHERWKERNRRDTQGLVASGAIERT